VNGQWTYLEQLDGIRNYDVFSILIGVRNYYRATPMVDSNRGLPIDITPRLKETMEDIDYHNFGYLTKSDVDQYPFWDTSFIDTREPKQGPKGQGGMDSFQERYHKTKLNPADYETRTPRQTLDESPEWKQIIMGLEANYRLVFAFDN